MERDRHSAHEGIGRAYTDGRRARQEELPRATNPHTDRRKIKFWYLGWDTEDKWLAQKARLTPRG